MEGLMVKNTDEKSVAERRDFLKLASAGTLLGGAAIATGGKAQAAVPVVEEGSGYRETDHVKTYYELSRF